MAMTKSAQTGASKRDELYRCAQQAIDEKEPLLRSIGRQIWENPELGLQETFAHDLLTRCLEDEGFEVTPKYILQTGFLATCSPRAGGPNVAVICEFDALPTIGHACGHNLIAEAGKSAPTCL